MSLKTNSKLTKDNSIQNNSEKKRGRPKKELTPEEQNKTKYEKYKEYQQNYHKKYFQENKAKYNEIAKIRRKKINKLLQDNNLNLKNVRIV